MPMKLMSLDTLALQRELGRNGLDEAKATEIAVALTEVIRVSELQIASKDDLALLQVSMVKLLDAAETERLILSDAMHVWTDIVDIKHFIGKLLTILYFSLVLTFTLVVYVFIQIWNIV
jgi:hypothetical protein